MTRAIFCAKEWDYLVFSNRDSKTFFVPSRQRPCKLWSCSIPRIYMCLWMSKCSLKRVNIACARRYVRRTSTKAQNMSLVEAVQRRGVRAGQCRIVGPAGEHDDRFGREERGEVVLVHERALHDTCSGASSLGRTPMSSMTDGKPAAPAGVHKSRRIRSGAGATTSAYTRAVPLPRALLALLVLGMVFIGFLATTPARAWREARMFQLVWNNVGVSQVARFKCDLRAGRYIGLRVRNLLLSLLTLGFYRPFALVSEYRMKAESVTLHVKGGVDQMAGELVAQQGGIGDAMADAVGLDLVG